MGAGAEPATAAVDESDVDDRRNAQTPEQDQLDADADDDDDDEGIAAVERVEQVDKDALAALDENRPPPSAGADVSERMIDIGFVRNFGAARWDHPSGISVSGSDADARSGDPVWVADIAKKITFIANASRRT